MKAPWDYSTSVADGAEGFPNEPDERGIALGKELARLADVAEAEQRKQFPNQLPRCDDCAFSAGTRPNGCSFHLRATSSASSLGSGRTTSRRTTSSNRSWH